METVGIIGAILGIIAGSSLFINRICRHFIERRLIQYMACLCYQKISDNEDITWEDLELYWTTGFGGHLIPEEGHETVALLKLMCKKNPPQNAKWSLLLENLTRSLPQYWVVTPADAGINTGTRSATPRIGQRFGGCGTLIMLLSMVTALFILNGHTLQSANVGSLIIAAFILLPVGLPVLILFPLAIFRLWSLIRIQLAFTPFAPRLAAWGLWRRKFQREP